MICGEEGAGKSTVLRALAGMWPFVKRTLGAEPILNVSSGSGYKCHGTYAYVVDRSYFINIRTNMY